jgi:C4-dicarboxylate-specific signal transduction histidine kinase
MNNPIDKICQYELAFFGRITAGITHEIKNGLAVIKEKNGLISDLLKMTQKGHQLDFARIHEILDQIQKRIDCTNDILKDLNSFSHSTDNAEVSFDLNDVLTLFTRLVNRFVRMQNIELKIITSSDPVKISNNPFLLKYLLFIYLEEALKLAGKGGKIIIAIENQKGCPCYVISGTFASIITTPHERREELDFLSKKLNCSIEYLEEEAKTLILFSPKK